MSLFVSKLRVVFPLILFGLYSNTTGLSSWRQPMVINNCARRYAWKFFSSARWSMAGRPDRGLSANGKRDDVRRLCVIREALVWMEILRLCTWLLCTKGEDDILVRRLLSHWRQEMGETEFRRVYNHHLRIIMWQNGWQYSSVTDVYVFRSFQLFSTQACPNLYFFPHFFLFFSFTFLSRILFLTLRFSPSTLIISHFISHLFLSCSGTSQ